MQLHGLCDVGENLQDAVQGLVQTVTHTGFSSVHALLLFPLGHFRCNLLPTHQVTVTFAFSFYLNAQICLYQIITIIICIYPLKTFHNCI